MKKLTNKARVVLGVLREGGEMSCQEVSDTVEKTLLPCPDCDGEKKSVFEPDRCKTCHGRGHRFFGYSTAYQALKQLKERGLVTRRYLTDEFGDMTPRLVWSAVPVDPLTDPVEPAGGLVARLEALWELPAAERS